MDTTNMKNGKKTYGFVLRKAKYDVFSGRCPKSDCLNPISVLMGKGGKLVECWAGCTKINDNHKIRCCKCKSIIEIVALEDNEK